MSTNVSSFVEKQALKQDVVSVNSQAQTLLVALRNIVIPIAQTATVVDEQDIDRDSFGPEAQEFLTALQKFIASIIRSQAGQQDNIQADKEDATVIPNQTSTLSTPTEGVPTTSKRDDGATAHITVTMSPKSTASLENRSQKEGSTGVVPSIKVSNNLQQPQMLKKTLSVLWQHVFNTMPIRLLRFGTYQSQFEITLVEREQIFGELARQFQAEFNEKAGLGNINDTVSRISQYSILSHTWLRGAPGEVTYDSWLKQDFDIEKPGYQKLYNFCSAAAGYGFTYGWMDTVCINKASSAELDESIRSMYKWYGNANICVIYLAATTNISAMDMDPWFTRGWTLQELVAQKYIKFYDMSWNKLANDWSNDKINPIILQNIESATMISHGDMAALAAVPISRRMQWAARREVTRGEDAAYSLMGIFNVNISIAYGEGAEKAFLRFLKEILNTTTNDVMDIFNWAGEYPVTNLPLLPFSPKAYLRSCAADQLHMGRPMEPLTLTHLGIRIPVVLLLAAPTNNPGSSFRSIGDYYATVHIQTSTPNIPHSYNVLDTKVLSLESRINRYSRISFAILNCPGNETIVYIPNTCFAVAITVNEDIGGATPLGYKQKFSTKDPIVFELLKKKATTGDTQLHYVVEKKKLSHHGMQQFNMIL